jgi:hypothetical protein
VHSVPQNVGPLSQTQKITQIRRYQTLSSHDAIGAFVEDILEIAPHDPELREVISDGSSVSKVFLSLAWKERQKYGTIAHDKSAAAVAQHLLGVMFGASRPGACSSETLVVGGSRQKRH